MNIILITQARTGSSRLPNKVLKKIKNKTLLEIHVDRIKKAKNVSKIIVATTIKKEDDIIENEAKRLGVSFSRGSENDVLDRFYQAVKMNKPDLVVRLTSDCPLIDPVLIDAVIEKAIIEKVDYCSNTLIESFPDGQDIEVFTFKALEEAWRNSVLISEREHVTPYIKKNSSFLKKSIFTAFNYESNLSQYANVRMTVDEPNDLITIEKLIDELGVNAKWYEYSELYIKTKSIFNLNSEIVRNEGYLKSINKEK